MTQLAWELCPFRRYLRVRPRERCSTPWERYAVLMATAYHGCAASSLSPSETAPASQIGRPLLTRYTEQSLGAFEWAATASITSAFPA